MAWFSGVLQDVRSRSNGLRERVREQAKALQRGVGIEKPALQSQPFLPAQEAESRIEGEAAKLSQCQSGSEVLERWLALMRTAPRRYTEKAAGKEDATPRQLSFKQVFLRSRALELALDASGRSAELRQALRTYALAAPARWPESCPPPMAFARAFVALLWLTVGPTEKWLQLLGTLLSSEQTPSAGNEAEEPCHTWLVQLIAGQRKNWLVAEVVDRASEIVALEDKAIDALKEADAGEDDQSFSEQLQQLSTLTSAVSAVESMAERRSCLAEDVERAILAEKEQEDIYANTVRSVATSAKALANSLGSDATHAAGAAAERAQLCSKTDGIKERLLELSPEMERLAAELAAAEELQSELLQQLKQNKEHIESLRRQRDVRRKEEEHLHQTLHRTERKLATHLATEDAVRQRSEASQALAFAVADVAEHLQAGQHENGSSSTSEAAPLTLTQQRNASQQKELILLMATGEVRRLKTAAEVGRAALPLAEDLAKQQQSPSGGGQVDDAKPDAGDEVEEAKEHAHLLQDLRQCLRALKTSKAEKMASTLEDHWNDADQGMGQEAAGLADELRKRAQACGELLEQLEAIPLPFEEERDCWEVVEDHDTGEAFLFGVDTQEREASGWDTSGLKNLFNGLAARAVGVGASNVDGTTTTADDPFLLDGLKEATGSQSKSSSVIQAADDRIHPAAETLIPCFKDSGAPEIVEKKVHKDPPTAGLNSDLLELDEEVEVSDLPAEGSPDADVADILEKQAGRDPPVAGSDFLASEVA